MVAASLFDGLIVKPIFNLLVLIYGLLPGHNFGLAIIVFTVVTRLLMWPLVKKQLHQATAMRKLQPELKRIKAAAKGNRQRESVLMMELYKERGISPFGSIGTLAIQFVILIGLYAGLNRVIRSPEAVISFSYGWLHNLAWLKILAADIGRFDATLLGLVDLKKVALASGQGIYWPAMLIAIGSAIGQYFQSQQLMPQAKDARKLRQILREAGRGRSADQSEVSAAVSRGTRWLIPLFIFIVTVGLPAALGLYWLVSGLTAYLQQARILRADEAELEATAERGGNKAIEGEVVIKKAPASRADVARARRAKTVKVNAARRPGKPKWGSRG